MSTRPRDFGSAREPIALQKPHHCQVSQQNGIAQGSDCSSPDATCFSCRRPPWPSDTVDRDWTGEVAPPRSPPA